jgi:hypothetical protein
VHLTQEQMEYLAGAEHPWLVRFTVAQLPGPGCAERGATDRDPMVRWAASNGHDLPEHLRDALDLDPEVTHVRALYGERTAA